MASIAVESITHPDQARQARIEQKAEQIARLLPGVLRRTRTPTRDDLLSVLLSEMAALQLDREKVLEELDSFYDPERAPLDSLVYLAYWMDLEPLIAPGQPPGLVWRRRNDWETLLQQEWFPTGLERLRALVAAAVPLLKQRGTPRGLQRFLETATGVPGFEVIESTERPFHIRVVCPAEAKQYIGFVRRIIEFQKPAYLTYKLIEPADTESGRG